MNITSSVQLLSAGTAEKFSVNQNRKALLNLHIFQIDDFDGHWLSCGCVHAAGQHHKRQGADCVSLSKLEMLRSYAPAGDTLHGPLPFVNITK